MNKLLNLILKTVDDNRSLIPRLVLILIYGAGKLSADHHLRN